MVFYLEPLGIPKEEYFTDHYLNLSKNLFAVREKGEKYKSTFLPLNEKILRMFWNEQKFERRGLKTVAGEKVCIISPGEWNRDEGPDFKGAEIRFGEKIVSGDVEIDLKVSDWKAHQHHTDERYNQVILHVVYLNNCKNEKFAKKVNNRYAERIALSGTLREDYQFSTEEIDNYPFANFFRKGQCGKRISARNYPLMEKLLLWAGAARFLLKTERFKKQLANSSYDQLLYEGIMEGLGYKMNRKPMLLLSRMLPLEKIKIYGENVSSEKRTYFLEAVYFYLSGLLPEKDYFLSSDPETKKYLKKLWSILEEYKKFLPLPFHPNHWTYKGVRPANFPLRRLSGMSHFLNRYWQGIKESFFLSFYKEIKKANPLSELKKDFFQPGEGYFATHAQFSKEGKNNLKNKKVYALVGEERVLAILVNTLLPLSYLYALENKDMATQKLLYSFYSSLKKISTNRAAQLMASRLFGNENKFPLETEQKQQGLLQIFHDFCEMKISACKQCLFPQVFDLSMGEINR